MREKRMLKDIGTWEEFQHAWRKIHTVPEAIGLLYHLGEMWQPLDVRRLEPSREFIAKLTFLLNVFDEVSEEGQVADTARKMLASRKLFEQLDRLANAYGDEEDVANVCMRFLEFFVVRHRCLMRPPFPGEIQSFLRRAWTWYCAATSGHRIGGGAFDFYTPRHLWHRHFLDVGPYVRAVVIWGCADVLATRGPHVFGSEKKQWISLRTQACEILPSLEEGVLHVISIDKPQSDTTDLYKENFVRWSLIDTRPLSRHVVDLRNEDDRAQAKRLASRTLIWARLTAEAPEDEVV